MTFAGSVPSGDVVALTTAAANHLAAQPWCGEVRTVTPMLVLEGIVGVFRCMLHPSHPDADIMMWVVVGDLPPACVVHEPGDSWQDALIGYVAAMQEQVDAAGDHAELLGARLEFIQTRLIDVDPASVKSAV